MGGEVAALLPGQRCAEVVERVANGVIGDVVGNAVDGAACELVLPVGITIGEGICVKNGTACGSTADQLLCEIPT